MEPAPPVMDRRRELIDFLRGRRARLDPVESGLARGSRRRTPGLRREELAQLAGLSVDWYVRLEQGRDVTPSRDTLEALARALRLDDDERGHLFYLARAEDAPRRRARTETIEPSMARAAAAMDTPALVLGRRFDVLAANPAASILIRPYDEVPPHHRNVLWLLFTDARTRARYAELPTVERAAVAAFRAAAAAHVDDPDFASLVKSLLEASESFRVLWPQHDVRAKTSGRKVFRTEVGTLDLEWHALASSIGSEQRLVYYVAAPGSPDAERLARLLRPR